MTKSEFLYSAARTIFDSTAMQVNQLCDLSKTSSMVANLFTTLPMKVEARYIEDLPKPSKKLNQLNHFVHAYLKHDDATKVILAFFYSSEKQLDRIDKAITRHPEYFSYLYMREALKLTRRMNTATHYRMMSNIIKHNAPSISPEEHYRLATIANNYATNSTLALLFESNSKLYKVLDTEQYDPEYKNDSEMDILVDILSDYNPDDDAFMPLDDTFSYDEWSNEVFDCTDNPIDPNEFIQTDLGESVSAHLASMSKGGPSASIFAKHFKAKKVNTGWFKKLSTKFNRDVYHITNTFTSSWSGLNITYRKQFKAPKHKYEDNALSIILSVDQSGSIADEALSKLLYLIEKKSKQITRLQVLVHDTEVGHNVLIENKQDIKSDPNFNVLRSRTMTGGTSHREVFATIAKLIDDKVIEPDKTIYISLSDNCSDIPTSYKLYKPQLSELASIVFFSPVDNPVNLPGTLDITME